MIETLATLMRFAAYAYANAYLYRRRGGLLFWSPFNTDPFKTLVYVYLKLFNGST